MGTKNKKIIKQYLLSLTSGSKSDKSGIDKPTSRLLIFSADTALTSLAGRAVIRGLSAQNIEI